jgi:hypothetical protein
MRHTWFRDGRRLVLVAFVVPFVGVGAHAQGPSPATVRAATRPTPKDWTPPRTPDGQPDLQGVWDYRTVTPLERPDELSGRASLTDEEAATYERQQAVTRNRDRRDGSPQADVARAYNQFWWDYGTKVAGHQTSLIVDPPDGRMPARTPEGQKRVAGQRGFQTTTAREEGSVGRGFDSWLDRPLAERCLLWGVAGPPMMPGPYNNNVQLFQSRDYVVIVNEMIHEHRVIPLDGRPHVASMVRQWMGDSRGHWEGNTLIVETTNFSGKTSFRGASEQLRLVERFTRVAPETLVYEFTVDDPASFVRPWTVRIPMVRSQELIYEYACHEGNYALPHALEGSRNLEKASAAAKTGAR